MCAARGALHRPYFEQIEHKITFIGLATSTSKHQITSIHIYIIVYFIRTTTLILLFLPPKSKHIFLARPLSPHTTTS